MSEQMTQSQPPARLLWALALGAALLAGLLAAAPAQAAFGIARLSTEAQNRDGSADLLAGSHPYTWTLHLEMNQDAEGNPEGTLRDLIVDLPAGLVGNPQALPRCSGADFEGQAPHCPGNTQIGVARVKVQGIEDTAIVPVYNLTPPLGVAGEIGFSIINTNSFQEASLRPSDYGIRASDITIPTDKPIQWVTETLWGVPMEESHDAQRFCHLPNGSLLEGCGSEAAPEAFFTLPTACGAPLATTVSVDSVQAPGAFASATAYSLGNAKVPAGLLGCDRPPFNPAITAQPETTAADSPSGLDFALRVPQSHLPKAGDPEGTETAAAHLRDAVVTLPAGLAVNPSAADGLEACSEAQIELGGPNPPACPAASQVGTVQVKTPLLDHTVPGTVYLARQEDNPFGSLLAIYIALDDPISGVIVKLAGKVEPDPATGQLRTTVAQNPQLPFEEFSFHFTGGQRATFTTPTTCGDYQTTAALTPWTSPSSPTVNRTDSFSVGSAAGGGPCASSESALPNSPSFEAGTTMPLAGHYSPFVLKLARDNGSQQLRSFNVSLPPGIAAKFAGKAECSDAQIAAAEARSNAGEGALERSSPSCPAGSELGVVNVGAGSGTQTYVQGHAYLAGPYKGAPFSIVAITPAIAGPFDLGTVVVRSALYVNEETAQGTVKSDPIPTILHGIPLEVRSIAIRIDNGAFTLNPTSCEAKTLGAEVFSTTGAVAQLANRFQVGGCKGLEFKPRVRLQLKGATKRSGHPALKAVVTYPKKGEYANIARAQVGLPHSEFLDQGNLDKVCKQAELRSATCPKRSIYGHAKAWTPLLDKPLQGPVYLGVGFGHKLPDLVADLNGQIRILLHGRVDTTKHDGIRNTFEVVPDAPVSRFELKMKGGKRYGLLENSENICRKAQRANARFVAQNRKVAQLHPKIANSCRHKKKHKKRRGHHRLPRK